ncbi:hypothetical protein HDA39_000497 [Kribbella italica]|uniref:Uncharacterized protein n=1 Tax=Kribbella italica TaxID=1540520 RepID=A0A7W9MSC7_9ACTN|nr:hypothetical protein [Kribbella italica]
MASPRQVVGAARKPCTTELLERQAFWQSAQVPKISRVWLMSA